MLVSRGELIEIGDGFRIPDVLARSGARLVEVGTTNRTRAADYEHAIDERDGAAPARAPVELPRRRLRRAAVARGARRASRARARCRCVDDLGSGALLDLVATSRPRARRSPPGADLVCFSGDKLLGGPQAGIVVGRADLVERLRRHPLHRALRIDKLSLAALEGTLLLYLDPERALAEVPVLRMLRERADAVRARAERLAAAVGGEVEETVGARRRRRAAARRAAVVRVRGRGVARRAAPRATSRRSSGSCATAGCCSTAARSPTRSSTRSPPRSRMPLTVGTAGHIDHGKTWLVRALTGKDTDRLPEEQARGISIDLGYAPLELPDGRRLSLVDVPGHERFVRTMIAGATGIDLFLLVIDAHEGARPQTLEHLAVLRLLGVEHGVVAVTKADAVDEETLELARGGGARARAGRRGRRRVGEDRRRARRAARGARATAGRASAMRAARHGSTSTACSRCAASGRSRPGRSGRARSPPATSCGSSRRVARCACARCRCTTRPSSTPRQGSASPSTCLSSSGATSRAATCSSRPATSAVVPTRRPARRSSHPCPPRSRCTSARTRCPRASFATAPYAQLRLASASSRHAATASCCAPTRRSAAASCSIPSPPRGLEPERLDALERGDAGSVRPRARAAGHARAGSSPTTRSRRFPSHGELVYSDAWLERAARVGARATRGRARTRSTRASPRRAAPRARVGARARSMSSGTARRRYLPGATAALGERAGAAAAARGTARGRGDREGRRPRARRATSRPKGACAASATATRSRPALYDRGVELLPALEPITLAAFRDALGVGRRTAQLLLERYDADGLTLRRGDERSLRRKRDSAMIVVVAGPLASGKSTLVQAIARGLRRSRSNGGVTQPGRGHELVDERGATAGTPVRLRARAHSPCSRRSTNAFTRRRRRRGRAWRPSARADRRCPAAWRSSLRYPRPRSHRAQGDSRARRGARATGVPSKPSTAIGETAAGRAGLDGRYARLDRN